MKTEHELILNRFDLETPPSVTEEQLITLLADRIAELLDQDPGLLFSTFYRLDISEKKIQHVLHSPDTEAAFGLAKLVLERQKEKLKTRMEYQQKDDISWEDSF